MQVRKELNTKTEEGETSKEDEQVDIDLNDPEVNPLSSPTKIILIKLFINGFKQYDKYNCVQYYSQRKLSFELLLL